jgi:isoquinoline 1-oxidoreductase beta subunit
MTALTPSRRGFLLNAAASVGVFTLGTTIPFGSAEALPRSKPVYWLPPYNPNVFLQIGADNTVTLLCKHLEMGQGVVTGLATLVAEELGADWSQMHFDFAPANLFWYRNLQYVGIQATGASTSMREAWTQMRQVGAAARAMFVAAAAREWKVDDPAQIKIENGIVTHGDRHENLGHFAAAAMHLPPPWCAKLKDPKEWRLIGKDDRASGTPPLRRLDGNMKTDGSAQFTFDVCRTEMLTVVVRRPDLFGATITSFDAKATRRVPGVVHVRQLPTGVAVYATNTWAAIEGRKKLKITCDTSKAEKRSTADMITEYFHLLDKADGNVAAPPVAGEHMTVEADFVLPFLANAPMEPLNCTVELSDDGAEIWSGAQLQTVDHAAACAVLGLAPWNVKLHTMLVGGSFGRRGSLSADLVVEACHAAKAIAGSAPVHLVRTREDDLQGGYYRPMVVHSVQAGVTKDGRVFRWNHQIVGKSIYTEPTSIKLVDDISDAVYVRTGFDDTTVQGVTDTRYTIDNLKVRQHDVRTTPVPVTWWRSVGHSHTAFVMETVIDELAARAGVDPVEFRIALLRKNHDPHGRDNRDVAVVKLARDKANWRTTTDEERGRGCGRGFAFHHSFDTSVAMVAEVKVDANSKTFKVDRIVAAVDVGVAINRDIVVAQVEGAVGFALSTVLRNEITLQDGVVKQRNFDDYQPTRMREMPKVEVHIVNSQENPSGIGEPGVPPVAPAIGNAIADAMGKREWRRTLPIKL